MLAFLSAPTILCGTHHKGSWASESQPSSPEAGLNSRWWRYECESRLLDTRLSQQIGRSRRVGASGTFNALVLTTAFNSAKISSLVFLYRDFGEQIEDLQMFDVTSETRDITSVIIFKSRLTLQVILPARISLMTPSLIDDSARP